MMGHLLSKRRRGRDSALLPAARSKTLSSPSRSRDLKRASRPRRANTIASASAALARRGKAYGSVKLRPKNRHTSSIVDKGTPWSCDEMEEADRTGRRKSEIRERDNFLELLSKVQDNRYNSQRYTIKAGPMAENSNAADDVFEDSSSERHNSLKSANGFVQNGKSLAKRGSSDLPTVEITDSPSTLNRRIHKAASVGSMSAISHDSRSPDEGRPDEEGRPSSAGSRGQGEETDLSLSPTQSLTTEAILSPSRKGTEALKKAIVGEGPYPLLIESPDGGYWVQSSGCEVAQGEDGVWRAPEISTEHYTIQTDKTASVYGRYFKKQDHQNYITRDTKKGPIILSLKQEEDYQGNLARVLIRTQKETVYKLIPSSQLPAGTTKVEPEDYIKIASLSHGSEMNVDKVLPMPSAKATDLLQKFDEHPLAKTHKFGVIYQQFGQTCEEELFGNVEHPDPFIEFLEMLGDKVELKGFDGYRGGLDITNNQTGEHSIYTEFKDRKIMFHVSTLLPHDQGDTQYVQKKRHIGNDIVVIIFQDANTPFCPSMIRSHFVHAYIVVQVEHPNTDHTVYKVAIAAKNDVPDFGPPLPDPAIFQKGAEFRDWLLMKALNAEFNCHQAPSFKKLATRTRNQLYLHLVEEVAQTIEDVDGVALSRELTASLDRGSAASPDVHQLTRHKKRRRTLTGMFSSVKKQESPLGIPSPHLGSSSKRKSATGSPKVFRRYPLDLTSPVRHMLAGSTPDLVEEIEQRGLANPQYIEQPDTKKEKSSITRRLTFRKNQDSNKDKEKKKPKRTASVNGPSGYNSIVDYRQKRTKGNISPLHKRQHKRHDSSEESSIASGTNLGGSVPSDLPGTVEGGERLGLNSSAIVHTGSTITLEDVNISMGQLETVDVAIQCSPEGSSITRYYSHTSPQPPRKGEHSKRLHSVNALSADVNPQRTQSLPGTPTIKKHRSPDNHEHYRGGYLGGVRNSPVLRDTGLSNGRESAEILTEEDKIFYQAESLDSVTTATDEMYNSLLLSLDSVNSDAARLREQNFTLIRENVRFASQNRDLKTKYSEIKEQLATAQQQIQDLEQKLQLCQLQPSSPQE